MIEVLQPSLADAVYNANYAGHTRVAFAREFGEEAMRRGVELDVDYAELNDALDHVGMLPEEYGRFPLLIPKAGLETTVGGFINDDPEERGISHLYFYISGSQGYISKKAVAHEATHARQYTKDASFSDINRPLRKGVAAAAAMALTGAYSYFTVRQIEGESAKVIMGSICALLGDASLCSGLIVEYKSRWFERKARAVEKGVEEKNLLVVRPLNASQPCPSPTAPAEAAPFHRNRTQAALRLLACHIKDLFVPEFDL